MQSRKNRPTNGPGANHLRGGASLYSPKTAVGPWMETVGGPSGYTRGYTTDEFMTEAQLAQLQGKRLPKYGAALPPPRIALSERDPAEFALSVNDTSKDHFKSTSMLDLESIHKPPDKEVYAPKKRTGGTDAGQVEVYRASWTNENPDFRELRFDTESRRAANFSVKDDFKVRSVRTIPGTPQGFEIIFQSLVEKYGILAISAFRKELGMTGERDSTELRISLMNCGVKLSREHFGQVMAFLTRAETFQPRKLFDILSRPSDKFDRAVVEKKFVECFGEGNTASEQEVAELYPDLEKALLEFLCVYSSNNGLTSSDFILLHSDMFLSLPLKYKSVIESKL